MRQKCDHKRALVQPLDAKEGAPYAEPEDRPYSACVAADGGDHQGQQTDDDEKRAGDELDHFADKTRLGLGIESHRFGQREKQRRRSETSWHCQHHDGCIVAKLSSAIAGNRSHEMAPDIFGAGPAGFQQRLHDAFFAEFLAVSIFCLGHAVGEEDEAITASQLNAVVFIGPVRQHAEHGTIAA